MKEAYLKYVGHGAQRWNSDKDKKPIKKNDFIGFFEYEEFNKLIGKSYYIINTSRLNGGWRGYITPDHFLDPNLLYWSFDTNEICFTNPILMETE